MPTWMIILLKAWGVCALLMFFLWLVQVRHKNASYVDIGWTLGIALCAFIFAIDLNGYDKRQVILVLMVSLWAIRLSALLMQRVFADPEEDRRYAKIRADWKTHQHLKFFFFFQFQALLSVVLSVCFLAPLQNGFLKIMPLEYAAIILWVIGFLGESLADAQLKQFKANPANKGKACQVGLWNYSRHPNYFFEWLMWVAYFIFGLASGGWVGIIAPVLMYYFLMHVSGVPLAEAQSLKTRGEEYRRYQQNTSLFVPWFKKKQCHPRMY